MILREQDMIHIDKCDIVNVVHRSCSYNIDGEKVNSIVTMKRDSLRNER